MFAQLREQFAAFWERQSGGQRAALISLVAAGVVVSALFMTWASTPSYAVAFSGLAEADAGQIVEALNTDGIPYRLEGGGTILVPSDKVYEVRLRMARQGLPEGGTVGFELFSGSTFGMTEFTQRVNYQRALEGELERTIGSLQGVQAVRVHIVTPEKSLLAGDQPPATASVTIKVSPGRRMDAAQVRAITHLVASSVEDLQPENVVVVDVDGNLLAAGVGQGEAAVGTEADARRAAEAAYAAELQDKVRTLLDSVLGPNRSVVQASVAMDWTEREVTTQSYDPETAAVRSSQVVSERYSTEAGLSGGIPGAASNLPTPTAEGQVAETNANFYERSEEITNYEITQTQTREVIAPGQVKRVSLSVLVDGVSDGAELETLRAAILAAVGIDEARGDSLAVESLAFDRSYFESQAAELEKTEKTGLYFKIGQGVAAALVLAALLFYVQRLLSGLKVTSSRAWTPVLKPASELALGAGQPAPRLTGGSGASQAQLVASTSAAQGEPQLERFIAQIAQENPARVAEVIQLWLSEGQDSHGGD